MSSSCLSFLSFFLFVSLTVQKEGVNKGRQFYGCSKPREQSCGFFQWADQDGNQQQQQGGVGGGGGGGGGWRTANFQPRGGASNYRGSNTSHDNLRV